VGPKNTPAYFSDVQDKIKIPSPPAVLGIFANWLLGPSRMTKAAAGGKLIAVAHYLDALQWQKESSRFHAVCRREESASELSGRRRALLHQHE